MNHPAPRSGPGLDRHGKPTPVGLGWGAAIFGLMFLGSGALTGNALIGLAVGGLCAAGPIWLASGRGRRWRRQQHLAGTIAAHERRMRVEAERVHLPLSDAGPITAPDDVVALDEALIPQIRRAAIDGIDCAGHGLSIPLTDEHFDRARLSEALGHWLALADALGRFAAPEQAWCVARALDPAGTVDDLIDAVQRLRDLGADALVDRLGERLRRTRGVAEPLMIARALGDAAAAAAVLDGASTGDDAPDATDSELFELVERIFAADPDPALLEGWSRHPWPGVRLAALLVAPDALPPAVRAALVDDPAPRVAAAARQQTLERSPPDAALALAREMLQRPLPSPEAPDWRVLDAALAAIDLVGREGMGDDVPLLEAAARRPHLGPAAEAAEQQIKARFAGRRGVLSLVEPGARGGLSEPASE